MYNKLAFEILLFRIETTKICQSLSRSVGQSTERICCHTYSILLITSILNLVYGLLQILPFAYKELMYIEIPSKKKRKLLCYQTYFLQLFWKYKFLLTHLIMCELCPLL